MKYEVRADAAFYYVMEKDSVGVFLDFARCKNLHTARRIADRMNAAS